MVHIVYLVSKLIVVTLLNAVNMVNNRSITSTRLIRFIRALGHNPERHNPEDPQPRRDITRKRQLHELT